MLKEAIPHFAELSSSEKLLLLEELWDDLADSPSEVPVPDWQKRELEKRFKEYLRNPAEEAPWPEVRERLLQMRGFLCGMDTTIEREGFDRFLAAVPHRKPEKTDQLPE